MIAPLYADEWLTMWLGDCRAVMAAMEPDSVQTVVTSPPYWGLRDYGLPPTVWGGGSGHDHAWGDPVLSRAAAYEVGEKARWNHRTNGRGEAQKRILDKGAGWTRKEVEQGAVCECGAWSGALGLEPTPDLFVAHVVELFREVRRLLRKDGTVWLNLGDSYAAQRGGTAMPAETLAGGVSGQGGAAAYRGRGDASHRQAHRDAAAIGLKHKDRVMIPARVALALQADGWWLRDEIVWHKPNPMPSSVRDRTTPAHEMVYLLTKSARYHYDADAIKEPMAESSIQRINQPSFDTQTGGPKDYGNGTNPNASARKALENVAAKHRRTPAGWNVNHDESDKLGRYTQRESTLPGNVSASTERTRLGINGRWDESEANGTSPLGRNKRSVWTIATQPYPDAHFATFPEALVEPMILAGCPAGGVVLDPFGGSGTVAMVANRLGRRAVHIDLSAEYADQAIKRIAGSRAQGEGPAIDMPVPFADGGLWAEGVS